MRVFRKKKALNMSESMIETLPVPTRSRSRTVVSSEGISGCPDESDACKFSLLGTPLPCGNQGVVALAASLVRLFTIASPRSSLRFLLIRQETTTFSMRVGESHRVVDLVHCRKAFKGSPVHHFGGIVASCLAWRLLPVSAWRRWLTQKIPWLQAITESRFVGDIRGGDSFSDIYGLRRLIEGSMPAWTALMLKRPLVQLPQTFGPFKSRTARFVARYLLARSAVVIARDLASQVVARDLLKGTRTVLLSPDVAFALEAIRPAKILLKPPFVGFFPAQLIGLNVNGLMYRGGYSQNNMFGLKLKYQSFLEALVIRFLRETTVDLLLIPHTWAPADDVESDNQAATELLSSLPNELRHRVHLVAAEYDAHEVKWIIGQCDFVIAGRMHACIAALSQGVPAVGIAYSMKFRGVFESVGMEDWVIDGRIMGDEDSVSRVLSLYQRRDSVRKSLATAANQARQTLFALFKQLADGTIVSPK